MKKYDVEADWHINEYCNFECKYCYDQTNKKKKDIGYRDIKRIVNGFNDTGLTWLIHMSGGEPQFFHGFVQLCEMLTEKHFVSMNTNLSHKNIYEFADKVPPEKVGFIHCSLHIQERGRRLGLINDYIDKYNMLKNKGYYIFASYVMFPQLVNRYETDYEYFKKNGIILMPKIYRGDYTLYNTDKSKILRKMNRILDGNINKLLIKKYPDSYSHKQKSVILKYIEKSQFDMNLVDGKFPNIGESRAKDLTLDVQFIDGLLSFKGEICLAGKNFVRITSNGDVYRCHDENVSLGNLFEGELKLYDKPTPCAACVCSCPYHGIRYIKKNINQGRKI